MEDFLWECFYDDVVTNGSHISDNKNDFYVGFDLERSNRRNLQKLVYDVFRKEVAHIYFSFVGNPYSGPDWNKPTLTIGESYPTLATRLISSMIHTFDENYELDTFVEKSSCLKIFKLYDLLNSHRWPGREDVNY